MVIYLYIHMSMETEAVIIIAIYLLHHMCVQTEAVIQSYKITQIVRVI